MVAIRDALREMEKVAAKLNEESDSLNEIIDKVEKSLADAGAGVEVDGDAQFRWERFPLGDGEDGEAVYSLGYRRFSNGWRIAAVRTFYGKVLADVDTDRWIPYSTSDARPEHVENWEISCEPLVSAPRQVRIEAFPLLERLVEQINEQMKRYLMNIVVAKKKLDA
jgi:hypothetical protein